MFEARVLRTEVPRIRCGCGNHLDFAAVGPLLTKNISVGHQPSHLKIFPEGFHWLPTCCKVHVSAHLATVSNGWILIFHAAICNIMENVLLSAYLKTFFRLPLSHKSPWLPGR